MSEENTDTLKIDYEAEYVAEVPIRCPSCKQLIDSIGIVRLLRSHVNFTSTVPRRGYVTVCTSCRAVLPADLGWV